MRLGFVQFDPRIGAFDDNLLKAKYLLDTIQPDVCVLPELCASGYLFTSKTEAEQTAEIAGEGKVYQTFAKWAREKDCLICGGFVELADNKLYNSAYSVEPDGKFHLYRKLHLFYREKLFFEPGNLPLTTFSFNGTTFGNLICFDWMFPETYRTLALAGTQVILHCTNLVLPYCQRASFTRAVENRIFIVISNRIGTESIGKTDVTFTGRSTIFSPNGDILFEAPANSNCAYSTDINPLMALDKKITPANDIFEDRRQAFYVL